MDEGEEAVQYFKIELDEYGLQEQVVNNIVKVEAETDSNSESEYVLPCKRPRKTETATQPHNYSDEDVEAKIITPDVEDKPDKKTSSSKTFAGQMTCKCKDNQNCPRKIKLERQKEIFYTVNQIQDKDWTQETKFIRASVKRVQVEQKEAQSYPLVPIKGKEYHQIYLLKDENNVDQEVCRDFFLKCLQTTPVRVFETLKTSVTNPDAAECRGQGPGPNKTPLFLRLDVQEFIDSIPKYESHYSNDHSHSKPQYLHHFLNLKAVYDEYKRVRVLNNAPHVGESAFRSIFNTENNLSFKRRHSDFCQFCRETKSGWNIDAESIQFREKHSSLVKKTCEVYADDVKKAAASNGRKVVLTFDLQKNLETPSLLTPEAFYRRPLWTYNLCVYHEVERKAWMYIWSENVAAKGGQEIGSCLIKHLKRHIAPDVNEIILYADPCGGQNRNIKLTMILKKFMHEQSNLTTIQQKYFVNGHSYNSCNRLFTKIESERRKSTEELYTPYDWIRFIQNVMMTHHKVKITVMQSEDFISSAKLIALIRRTQVSCLNYGTIISCKSEPYTIYPVSDDYSTLRVNFKKRFSTNESLTLCEMPTLFPRGRPISKAKYDDLIELLRYVPQQHHEFYKSLEYDDGEDYGLASDVSDG